MKARIGITGEFRAEAVDETHGPFENSITAEGLVRIAELMSGASSQPWSRLRLVGAGGEFVEKNVDTKIVTDGFESKALFKAGELTFAPVTAEMYAGSTKVAEAAVDFPGGESLQVIRRDYVREYTNG